MRRTCLWYATQVGEEAGIFATIDAAESDQCIIEMVDDESERPVCSFQTIHALMTVVAFYSLAYAICFTCRHCSGAEATAICGIECRFSIAQRQQLRE